MSSGTDSSLETCDRCGKWLDGVSGVDTLCLCPDLVRQIEVQLTRRINKAREQGDVRPAIAVSKGRYDCFLEVYLPEIIVSKISENNARAIEEVIWEFDKKLREIVGDVG